MSNLRRSTRASTSKVSYGDEFSPSYPDGEPANEFERRVALLDQESFPWEELSEVDDVIVYSLFSSKRRTKGYRAVKTLRAFLEEETAVTAEEGVGIRRLIGKYLPSEGERDVGAFRKVAVALVKEFDQIFKAGQVRIVEQ